MRSRSLLALALVALFGATLGGAPARGPAQTGQMPPGHPPIGGAPSQPAVPPPPADAGAQALTWKVPSGWIEETPASAMRRAQYRIPGSAGAGECAVFYFGPGQGGEARANAERWAGQFRRPDGSPVGDGMKTREIKVGDIPVLLVEVVGTYVGGMGGGPDGPERPNYMLLGAIAKGPDANWFFRATGPRAMMDPQRAAFEKMIRSLKRGQSL
jgi:hypothetical protein